MNVFLVKDPNVYLKVHPKALKRVIKDITFEEKKRRRIKRKSVTMSCGK